MIFGAGGLDPLRIPRQKVDRVSVVERCEVGKAFTSAVNVFKHRASRCWLPLDFARPKSAALNFGMMGCTTVL